MTAAELKKTLILDFDGSVTLPRGIDRVDLRAYEEKFRYFARLSDMARMEDTIKTGLQTHRIFFLGSGDFHHISYLIIKNMPLEKLQVVVFDNHPDNMFFPAGIHCGSWVYHASRLPNVVNISVLGIASRDLSGLDLVQNRFSVIKSGKVRYYCLTPVSRLARLLSGSKIDDIRAERLNIADTLEKLVKGMPVYLSIDKDVFTPNVAKTTWDQGRLSLNEVLKCIKAIAPNVAAADIVGDISLYRFKNPLKEIIRRIDGLEKPPADIKAERARHTEVNLKILFALKEING